MSKFWLIADCHFGHRNMERFCGRPSDFEERILGNIRGIKPHDTLIVLGDVCFGNDHYWLKRLNEATACRKILTRGNHDHKPYTFYLSHGFSFVCESFTLNIHGKTVIFSHRPLPEGDYDLNIHAHCHLKADNRYDDDKHTLITSEHHYYPQELRKIMNA